MALSTDVDTDECYEAALEIAQRAGKVANAAFHREKAIETKSCSADLVTETDKKVEQLIFSFLREKFPSHRFIGEESTGDDGIELSDDPTWMVDPIDGTTNFIHTFPFACVSIAMAIRKEVVVGVVYNFVMDQMYAAKKGGGATMNGKPIHVSQCKEKAQALVVTSLGSQRSEQQLRPKLETIMKLAKEPLPVHSVHMMGSAALNMCMVASGQSDCYYECGIHCWDIAAGDVIIRESGGVVMMPNGDNLDLMKRAILCASSAELAFQLVPIIQHQM